MQLKRAATFKVGPPSGPTSGNFMAALPTTHLRQDVAGREGVQHQRALRLAEALARWAGEAARAVILET